MNRVLHQNSTILNTLLQLMTISRAQFYSKSFAFPWVKSNEAIVAFGLKFFLVAMTPFYLLKISEIKKCIQLQSKPCFFACTYPLNKVVLLFLIWIKNRIVKFNHFESIKSPNAEKKKMSLRSREKKNLIRKSRWL